MDRLLKTLKKICANQTEQVFVYETLLSNKLRKKLLKRDVETHVDRIVGFREVSIESDEGPNHTLLPDEVSTVVGKRFSVTMDELRVLDRYEDEYTRKKIQLASGHTAWVYFLRVDEMVNKGRNLEIPN